MFPAQSQAPALHTAGRSPEVIARRVANIRAFVARPNQTSEVVTMSEQRKAKLAFIGCGGFATASIYPNIHLVPQIDLVAV